MLGLMVFNDIIGKVIKQHPVIDMLWHTECQQALYLGCKNETLTGQFHHDTL